MNFNTSGQKAIFGERKVTKMLEASIDNWNFVIEFVDKLVKDLMIAR